MSLSELKARRVPVAVAALLAIVVVFTLVTGEYRSGELVQGKKVKVDRRAASKGGSWDSNFAVHDQPVVERVWSLLSAKLQKGNATLIDVGANSGSFSLLPVMSRDLRVVSFEPNLEMADILRRNVELNNIEGQVTILPLGLSNKRDFLTLHKPKKKSKGLSTLGANIVRFEQGISVIVPVVTMDEIVQMQGLRPTFIKIDTEGWEYFVLLGAKETIQKYKPPMLLEFNLQNMQQTGVDPEKVKELLREYGYKFEYITEEDILCTPM